MWILHQVVVLLSIANFLEGQNPPSTPNSECDSMNTTAKHLKNLIKHVMQKDAQCIPNQHCTGVKCSWSNRGLFEVDLHHCQDPVYYHVLFNYPDLGISKNLNMTQGEEQTLYHHALVTVKIQVSKLERTNDIVTTTVQLELCTLLSCLPQKVMDNQKFCVRMQNCPGFNASAHQYTPCGYKPTSPPTKQPTSASTGPRTKQPTSNARASTGPRTKQPTSTTSASTGPPTKQPTSASTGSHTKQPTSNARASTGPPTKQPTSASAGPPAKQPTSASTGPPTKQPTSASAAGHIKTKPSPQHSPSTVAPSDGTILHHKGGEGDNKKGGLSTAAIIGICAAAVVAILVIVGVVVYWRKYYHRFRLRAAYYNDISMEEPLYNDFGPEIA